MLTFTVWYENSASFFCCRHLWFSALWKTGMAELCAWSCVPKFHVAKSRTVPWLSTLLFIPLQTRIMSLPLSSNFSDMTCLCMCKLYLSVEYRNPVHLSNTQLFWPNLSYMQFLYQQHEGSEPGPSSSRRCGTSKLEKLQLLACFLILCVRYWGLAWSVLHKMRRLETSVHIGPSTKSVFQKVTWKYDCVHPCHSAPHDEMHL